MHPPDRQRWGPFDESGSRQEELSVKAPTGARRKEDEQISCGVSLVRQFFSCGFDGDHKNPQVQQILERRKK
ncbi:hypothetical protein A3I35_03800 [Candidatus Falkowbacteria bacterium RIFCSPLOWO2_02_FULL_45_15]|uniref:Uncharacterized protein n=1 Tax=Candidatus Falkowbacteria bacterium RIFCSPLOWO2_02_FULL_45_15 TaxID=1797988 RepID=A0A1F5RXT6_9BACT|nr:MAG: hypothetical protein A3I35_03800 [Candidatus Falkowbacteria bacterium RIFCSPLOWO2_02_FULL_45_15]